MKTKLEELLELPFDQYLKGCWEHARQLARNDPVTNVVFIHMCAEVNAMEAAWARRYWFNKCKETTNGLPN